MIPMALQYLPFIAQGLTGLFQAGKGIAGMNTKRPEYEIPAAQNQATALAALQASGNMPSYNQATTNIGTATGNALTAARESGNPSALISTIQGNQNSAFNKLDSQNAMYQDQKQGDLQRALAQQAQYQDKAFQMNKFSPYLDKVQEGRQMFGAGLSNAFSAMSNANNFDMYQSLLKGVNENSNINAKLSNSSNIGTGNNGGIGGMSGLQGLLGGGNTNVNMLLNLLTKNPLTKIKMLGE